MRIGHNLLAGLGGSLWTALVGLAVIPFYVRYLGLEGYGLIGFLATAQAVIQILDLGLAATINREVARGTGSGDLVQARTLLHTLAAIYWVVAGVIAVAIALLSPVVAGHWLRADGLAADGLTGVVILMALVIACRWPGQLYQGVLIGTAHRHLQRAQRRLGHAGKRGRRGPPCFCLPEHRSLPSVAGRRRLRVRARDAGRKCSKGWGRNGSRLMSGSHSGCRLSSDCSPTPCPSPATSVYMYGSAAVPHGC